MSKILSDLAEIHTVRETPQADRNKFDWELQEYAKTHPISLGHLVEYCLWIIKQNPKALMPWEPGFEMERTERVLKDTTKSMKIKSTLRLASQFIQEQGGIVTTETNPEKLAELMTDKEIRHQVKKRGLDLATSTVSGPVHIVDYHGAPFCDPSTVYDARLRTGGRKLCAHCKKAAQKLFESENLWKK